MCQPSPRSETTSFAQGSMIPAMVEEEAKPVVMEVETNETIRSRTLVPPIRFAYVNPGLSRGAYPTLRNFRFLSRLQLKTIISLTPEPPIPDLVLFAEMAGIKLLHVPISRTSALSEPMQLALLSVVNVCIEAKNHPIYLHCLDGRRISSLVVLLLRRVQSWTPLASLSEYWRYQVPFRAPIPTLEVEKTTKELELFAAQCADLVLPESMPKWLWGGDRTAVVAGVGIKSTQPAAAASSTGSNNAAPAGVGASGSSSNVPGLNSQSNGGSNSNLAALGVAPDSATE